MTVVFRVSRRSLLLIALLVVVLFSSLFVCMFVNGYSAASLENTIRVKNETELKNAISNASDGKSTIIALDNDITLTTYDEGNYTYNYAVATLIIPANKDITLITNKDSGFYKLIGAVNMPTVIIGAGGVLRLDGIIVTHKKGFTGCGVNVMGRTYIDSDGMLYLCNGEISGNTANSVTGFGGGVVNDGIFTMSGGKISGNTAELGGGVYNEGNMQYWGTFIMSGGEITGNTADFCGGGVYNTFYSKFIMSGGEITGNTADNGGGVSMDHYSEFTMSGGKISGNTAFKQGGGVYSPHSSPFVMSGGTISGNAANEGGGVYVYGEFFDRHGGVISGNTATSGDNNVYLCSTGGGSSNGNNGQSVWNFDVKHVLVTCVIIIVAMGIAMATLFVYFQKRINQVEKTK
ncbi:MAG: hypothetical protein FWH37_07275 [Candidatus Bathyarchaeota archaeon]|nr:hypothetical protein [Candidatus Termiticorpusculum sp.]